jgi:hypothetical protein
MSCHDEIGSGFWVLGSGVWVQDSRFRVEKLLYSPYQLAKL